ncbi:PEGA domain-containing protein [Granulicella tundricola]|nr:PEGA domain-containing protein [Granulicella tundricola]
MPAKAAAASPAAPAGASAAVVATPNTLMDGTAVKLRLAETITSANAKVGQSVSFEVVDEVDVMGVMVVPKGAQALATVTEAQSKRSMGRGGKLDVNIDSMRLADGEKAALRATEGGKGGGHTGAMTAGIVGTAIVFFPAAPLLLFIHGKDISIPKGTEVTAFVAGDMHLEMAKFVPQDAPGVVAGTAVAQMASLAVDASVAGADIEVDGAFVGNTPSTVSVAAGKHEITVKKSGYQDWTRNMTVSGGAVRVSAEMVAK